MSTGTKAVMDLYAASHEPSATESGAFRNYIDCHAFKVTYNLLHLTLNTQIVIIY